MSFEEVDFEDFVDFDPIPKNNKCIESFVTISNTPDTLKKQTLLKKLHKLEQKGIKLNKQYDMNSDYDELVCEFYLHKKLDQDQEIKNSLKSCMNNAGIKYDKKYDELIDEIMNKDYMKTEKVNIPPEAKLIMSLVGSVFTHLIGKNIEVDDNILKK